MKVLYWTTLCWPDVGGMEVLAMQTLPALRAQGHEFAVVASHGIHSLPDVTEQDGIPIHRFRFREALMANDIKAIFAIQRRIAALKASFAPDLVHFNFSDAAGYFHLRTQKSHPVPTLFTLHSDFADADSGPRTMFGQCLRDANWISAVSQSTLDDVLKMVPEQAPYSSVILNGLKMPVLTPAPLPFEPAHLLCMGRLVPEKGFDVALHAFAALDARFADVRLSIVGDGPSRPMLEELAASLGIGERVTFTGWVQREEVAALINSATIVVIPSRNREPFALVALEAAQMGRPVVATRRGGLQESVADGKSGLLVENENVGAFARAIEFLLEHPERAQAMGQFGYTRAKDTFSLERCATAYSELYQRVGGEEG
ncbi:glycosyltransferase family 1 protein [bacterium]|nr:MAG: glycosyltransferase family 1 protein [bacterium]